MTTHASPGTRRAPRHGYQPPADARTVELDTLLGRRRLKPNQQQYIDFVSEAGPSHPIWCAGDLSVLAPPAVAIVGTRNPSPEGRARARKLARELARANVTIVSGLAKGIDTEALTEALSVGGRVAAVIGTPLDAAYPAENAALQERIYREHLLISPFAPGSRVFKSNFPRRNRLMAAVSDATAIMEASDTSGTLHQAAECVRLGRWLFIAFAVVNDPALQWPKKFLGDDKPRSSTLRATSDVLEVLGNTHDAASG